MDEEKSLRHRIIDRIPKTTDDLYLFALAASIVAIFAIYGQWDTAQTLGSTVVGGIMLYVKGK